MCFGGGYTVVGLGTGDLVGAGVSVERTGVGDGNSGVESRWRVAVAGKLGVGLKRSGVLDNAVLPLQLHRMMSNAAR
jgi:hypothetical protein